MSNVIGPDVSFYEDKPETPQGIDYEKMRKSAGFVIVRAGQNLWADPIFTVTWADARASGIARGSYWFYDSRADPKRQAEKYVETLGGDLGELPLFCDFEETYKGPYKGWKQWYTFIERLKTLVGTKEIGIYTAFYYWRDNAPNAIFQSANLEYFHQYPLWIAYYGVATPSIPKPWGTTEWLFWQYTDSGDGPLYGAESKSIDLNYFNGDAQALTKRFNLSSANPLPPPPPNPTPSTLDLTGYKYQVNTTAINMRGGPGMNFNKVGVLSQGNIVDAIQAVTDKSWIQIRRSDGLIGWCSAAYLIVSYTPPTLPPPTTIDLTGIKYQLIVPTLDLYAAPDTNSTKVGTVDQGDVTATVVDGILALADKSWIQIRGSDGLTGWCPSQYLIVYVPPSTIDQTGIQYQVSTATLEMHQTWDPNSNVVSSLNQGDVVDGVIAQADKSWIQIRRSDGLTGWCLGQSLTAYVPSTPLPPGTIDQTGIQYQVNIATLEMHQTWDPNSNVVGSLNQGHVVNGIVALADKSWIQIRRSDGLTGWCLGQSLAVYVPPTPPPPGTIDQTGIQFQVNVAGLNVREGPGVTYTKVGVLVQGDVVNGIVALADKSWIQVRRNSDGLTGWCSAAYLAVYVPPPPPPDQTWYRVNTTAVNVFSGPDTSNPVVGALQKGDVIASPAPGTSSDGSWVQITRVDGLTGWCASSSLVNLGKATPGSLNQKIYNGVTYFRKESSTPRKMIVHALGIDVQASGLQFLVTPPVRQSGPPLCSRKTSDFLAQYGVQIAVNADAFTYADPAKYDPKVYCASNGDPVWPSGYTVSRGNVYFNKPQVEPILIINQTNIIQFYQPQGTVKPDGQVFNAVSGDRMLVINGKPVSGLDHTRLDPRTAVGLSKDKRWLILVVVDGRETSVGATFVELANLLVSFGVYTGMSLDGGGSSTMVIQGVDKKPRILNTPVDNNTFGQERAVANHLGIFVKR
ncbi:MAG: SH3 domain-containing protein [Chloroflexi bacterium]|nr:SH3 domain-containing protein [Chloroflexota bacterium]